MVQSTPSFMSGTKASLAKNLPSKQLNVKNAIGAGGSFVKRMIESISNKKSVKIIEKLPDKLESPAKVPDPGLFSNKPSCSNVGIHKKDEIPKENLTPKKDKNRTVAIPKDIRSPRNNVVSRNSYSARLSHSSSSSLSASPVRKPLYSNDPRGYKPTDKKVHDPSAKLSTSVTSTPANKQRITQMRNRLKTSKETTSSSESDKAPPPRRIPPRTLKSMAAKSNNNNHPGERKLSAPDKTWQRLMSPPKTKTSSDNEQRIRAQSVSSASNYATAPTVRSSPTNEKSSSATVAKTTTRVWR